MKKLSLVLLICGLSIFSTKAQTTNYLMSSNAVWVFVTSYVQAYIATNPVNVQITNLNVNFDTNYFITSGTNVTLKNTNFTFPSYALTNNQSSPVVFSNGITVYGNITVTQGTSAVLLRTNGTIGSTGSITNNGNITTAGTVTANTGYNFGSFPGLNTNFQVYAYHHASGTIRTQKFSTSGGLLYSIQNQ